MDPLVKQRVALLLSLLLFSCSDPDPPAISGFYPKPQSDDHKLSAQQDLTTCIEKKNREMLILIIFTTMQC